MKCPKHIALMLVAGALSAMVFLSAAAQHTLARKRVRSSPQLASVEAIPVAVDPTGLPDDARQVRQRLQQDIAATRADAEQQVERERQAAVRELQLLADRYAMSNRAAEADSIRAEIDRINSPDASSNLPPSAAAMTSFSALRDSVGQSFPCLLMGTTSGAVWGTDVYTDESVPGAAAVHAGLLKPGEQGAVLVRILQAQDTYRGSDRNGVNSANYGHWYGSFSLEPLAERWDLATKPLSATRPPNRLLYALRGQSGRHLLAEVTGTSGATIWGDCVYTDDSPVGVAAVHAGLLRIGEHGFVHLIVRPSQNSYSGSTRNGIASAPYGLFGGSYQFAPSISDTEQKDASQPPMPALSTLRGHAGAVLYVKLTGSTTGIVWGSDLFSDDSDVATAAVHAGLAEPGQPIIVKLIIAPAQQQFAAATRNGVSSHSYGAWPGAFQLDRVPPDFTPPVLYVIPEQPAAPLGASELSR